jgi:hypothetical protein
VSREEAHAKFLAAFDEALAGLRALQEALQRHGFTPAQPSITCPRCGSVSYNPGDIEHRYCGRCHQFHQDFPGNPPAVVD